MPTAPDRAPSSTPHGDDLAPGLIDDRLGPVRPPPKAMRPRGRLVQHPAPGVAPGLAPERHGLRDRSNACRPGRSTLDARRGAELRAGAPSVVFADRLCELTPPAPDHSTRSQEPAVAGAALRAGSARRSPPSAAVPKVPLVEPGSGCTPVVIICVRNPGWSRVARLEHRRQTRPEGGGSPVARNGLGPGGWVMGRGDEDGDEARWEPVGGADRGPRSGSDPGRGSRDLGRDHPGVPGSA